MKPHTTVLHIAWRVLVVLALAAVPGDTTLSAFQLPASTVNQSVTVVGRLELEGQNYFLDPRFVIVDDQNNRIPVTSWAPLELPPPRPATPPPGSQRRTTMRSHLNQRYSVSGTHRVVAVDNPGQPTLYGKPGESYLEVQSVVDVASGAPIFVASTAPAPLETGLGTGLQPTETKRSTPIVPQPTGAQRPATPAGTGK